jgi:hypothetical protein
VDTASCDSIHLVPGVRGTSGGRDGEEKKMAPWAPRLMSGSLGRRVATLPKCLDSAVTDVGCQPDSLTMVLRVGFLTHQLMVGFGIRVGANAAEYFLQNLATFTK